MTLRNFEMRLQEINPRFTIKRYGTSLAGVHLGTRYLLRVPQGEITPYNVTAEQIGHADDRITPANPTGEYRFERLLRRGRGQVSAMLANMGVISNADAAKLRE